MRRIGHTFVDTKHVDNSGNYCYPVATGDPFDNDEEMGGMTTAATTQSDGQQQQNPADVDDSKGGPSNNISMNRISSFYDDQNVESNDQEVYQYDRDDDIFIDEDGTYIYGGGSSSTPCQRQPLSLSYACKDSAPLDDLHWRKIQPKDRKRIQELHEEWFPVSYQQEFYDSLVHERMPHTNEPLYTCVATVKQSGANTSSSNNYHTQASASRDDRNMTLHIDTDLVNGDNDANMDSSDETIIACVVGAVVNANKLNTASRQLLLSNIEQHYRLFYIMTLGTTSEYRHLGLGTALVEKCIEQVENDPHCGVLYLHVITLNAAAIRFYERLGFWRVQEIGEY